MKCLICLDKEMECYNDVNNQNCRIDFVQCPNCGSIAEIKYDVVTNGILKVIFNKGHKE